MIAYRDYWFYAYTLVLLILTSSLNSCGNATDAVPELSLQGQWQLEGLTDTSVTVTEADQNGVLVGTTKGLFKQQNEVLSNLGLNNYEIQGVVRLKNNDLIAGATPASYTQGDTTLFKLSNATSKWESFMTNFGGENREHSWINIGPITPYLFSDTLFVRGGGVYVP